MGKKKKSQQNQKVVQQKQQIVVVNHPQEQQDQPEQLQIVPHNQQVGNVIPFVNPNNNQLTPAHQAKNQPDSANHNYKKTREFNLFGLISMKETVEITSTDTATQAGMLKVHLVEKAMEEQSASNFNKKDSNSPAKTTKKSTRVFSIENGDKSAVNQLDSQPKIEEVDDNNNVIVAEQPIQNQPLSKKPQNGAIAPAWGALFIMGGITMIGIGIAAAAGSHGVALPVAALAIKGGITLIAFGLVAMGLGHYLRIKPRPRPLLSYFKSKKSPAPRAEVKSEKDETIENLETLTSILKVFKSSDKNKKY